MDRESLKNIPPNVDGTDTERNLQGVLHTFFVIVAVAMTVFQVYTAAYRPLESMQQRSLHLLFALVLIFVIYPAYKKGLSKPGILDWTCIVGAVASGLYIFFFYSREIVFRSGLPTTLDLVMGAIMLLLVLEATRRTIGPIMPALAVIFILYAAYGNYLPFLEHRGYDWERIISQAYLSLDGIFGSILEVSATFVFIFILFGAVLRETGGGQLFIDLAYSLFGFVRGGPAKVAVVASGLFGSISGSAVANVVSTGTFTIPLMKRVGYRPDYAGAVEAVASTGGQIMPPIMGAAAFIMAEVLKVPYLKIAQAAIIPAFLYYLAAFVAVDLQAARQGLQGVPRSQLERPLKVLGRAWIVLVPIAVLVYLLAVLQWSPMKVGFWSIVTTCVVTLFNSDMRLNWTKFLNICQSASKGILEVAAVCACAGIIAGVIMLTGLGLRFSNALVALSGGHLLALLLLAMVASIILGMGLPTTAVYILLAVLIAPAIASFGVLPIGAHLFVFYFGILSAITPPVCLAAFAAAGIAGSNPMKTGYTAWRLGIAAFIVPFMFIYGPSLLWQGSLGEIIGSLITASVGVAAIAAAMEGIIILPLPIWARLMTMAGGIALVDPGLVTDLVGLLLLGIIMAWQYIQRFRKQALAAKANENSLKN